MIYEHRFRVNASVKAVAQFHYNPGSMGAITPPPIVTQIHAAPSSVSDGAGMDFTLWFGPFPIRWQAIFEQVSENGFADRQVKGPFGHWVHKHTFNVIDPQITEVYDRVEAEYHPQLFWRIVGFGMWISLPVLFAFRGLRTRQLIK